MQGRKESWAYQLFQQRQHQPATLKVLICSKTSKASTLHVIGHLMLSKAETMHPKHSNQINKIQVL